ncbi:hypothetical protein [Wolbachia endosymbiont of Folsomia candida]|uniref:hypothetical protein n=1 Tax=Wolbachia endosymbiont of Folsomia candida TaxID=169402 RepID=UPI000ADE6110|nr:hypothetical protein [Wolbachia endosymbiont of Folsomia candida]APR98624.1 hypothetical protein ASM33_05235 [Wolbachia endosymbiont of Folsomia candida]
MQNQKIPLAVIITMALQTVALIWWLAKLDLRVHIHDKFIEQNNGLIVTVYRLEERVKSLSEELDEFKMQVFSSKLK